MANVKFRAAPKFGAAAKAGVKAARKGSRESQQSRRQNRQSVYPPRGGGS